MRRLLALAASTAACTSAPAPAPVMATNEPAPVEPAAPPPALSERELSARRDQVNRLYDQQDYEGAIARAEAILMQVPDDIRMLRAATSAHCILGNMERARAHWAKLPEHDQRQIATRCARFGATLP